MSVEEKLFGKLRPNSLLTRDQLVMALALQGYPIGYATLQQMKSRGDGPEWVKVGATILYQWGSALEWAEANRKKMPVAAADIDLEDLL